MAWLYKPVRDRGLNMHRMESLQLLLIGVDTALGVDCRLQWATADNTNV